VSTLKQIAIVRVNLRQAIPARATAIDRLPQTANRFRCNSPLTGRIPPSPATLKSVTSVFSREELISQRKRWRQEGKTVVFTNGCYDLLHPGHIRLLEQARSLGDILILALNSDASVRRSKGPSRPTISESERSALAASLEAVDAVALFDEETPRELIAALLPDILIKGADWSHFVAGREEVEASGGQVITIPLEPGFSTTNIVERILA
jgi:rfaE bifunctional protein nucleotidyltransferase chain/domain